METFGAYVDEAENFKNWWSFENEFRTSFFFNIYNLEEESLKVSATCLICMASRYFLKLWNLFFLLKALFPIITSILK